MPAFDAEYAAWPPLPISPTTDEMLMMRPASFARSSSVAAARVAVERAVEVHV